MADIVRGRQQLIQTAKALIKYCEGPGEIDSLLNDAWIRLSEVMLLMKQAHWRAIREREEAEARRSRRTEARRQIPAILFKKQMDAMREVNPEAFEAMLERLIADGKVSIQQ